MIFIDPRRGSGGYDRDTHTACTAVSNEHQPDCLIPLIHRYIVPASLVEHSYIDNGDFAFAGNGPDGSIVRIGGEIKHAPDVLQCIDDGRFAGKQLIGMQKDFDHYWLLIEDDLKPEPSSGILMRKLPAKGRGRYQRSKFQIGKRIADVQTRGASEQANGRWAPALFGSRRTMKYSDLVKWLFSMEVIGGLKVWRTKSRDETAQWIVALYHWWNDKRFDQHKAVRVFDESTVGRRSSSAHGPMYVHPDVYRIAQFAKRFDGVGYERALTLGRKFASIEELVLADVDEFIIKSSDGRSGGIGKALAESIHTQIRQRKGTGKRK